MLVLALATWSDGGALVRTTRILATPMGARAIFLAIILGCSTLFVSKTRIVNDVQLGQVSHPQRVIWESRYKAPLVAGERELD